MVLMKQSASGRLALSAILMRWATFRFSGRKRDSLISYKHRFRQAAAIDHRSTLADQIGPQALGKRQSLARVVAETT
jgi:hypothetical protein